MAQKSEKNGVMGNLPATRPSRLSRRGRAEDEAPAPAPARTPAKPAATRPKAVRAASPKLSEPARKARESRGAGAGAAPAREQSGVELATTVVKAAGELAQIGATVAGQIIKRATSRLPKP